MKLYLEVIPNAFNDSGYVVIVSKGWKYLNFEIGRIVSQEGLDKFLRAYQKFDGQIMSHYK